MKGSATDSNFSTHLKHMESWIANMFELKDKELKIMGSNSMKGEKLI
jgi:hypothetical protein